MVVGFHSHRDQTKAKATPNQAARVKLPWCKEALANGSQAMDVGGATLWEMKRDERGGVH